jgi:hypothetical protein
MSDHILTQFRILDTRATFQATVNGALTTLVKVSPRTFGTPVTLSPSSIHDSMVGYPANGQGETLYFTGETDVNAIGGLNAMVLNTGLQIAETKDW